MYYYIFIMFFLVSCGKPQSPEENFNKELIGCTYPQINDDFEFDFKKMSWLNKEKNAVLYYSDEKCRIVIDIIDGKVANVLPANFETIKKRN